MKLTRKAEYAIRVMLYLSSQKPNTKVIAKEISKNMDIPKQFLAQIMLSLNHHGFVKAIRGAKGGFMLARKPSSVNLLEIIEAIEGKLFLNECLLSTEVCKCQPVCPISEVWQDAQKALLKILKSATFSSLVKKTKDKKKFLNKLKKTDACCKTIYVAN